jgi:hypothetical protein
MPKATKKNNTAMTPREGSLLLSADNGLKEERHTRRVEFACAARAQRKLAVADLEGAFVNAVTDGIADGVQFAERAFGGNIEPCADRREWRQWDEPTENGFKFEGWVVFASAHYMRDEYELQEKAAFGY